MGQPPLVAWIDQPEAREPQLLGEKFFNLAALAAQGLPVPPAFVVTTEAYRSAVDTGDGLPTGIPTALADEIAAAYRLLGEGKEMPVAVRSSSTAEDLAGASFAGQQDTLLDVTGVSALLDAVARCWISLHSDRVVAYRREQGLEDSDAVMAVGIQLLVPAKVAGVMFTRNPASGDDGELVVESSWGLGETVVSGLVSPDRYVLDKGSGETRELRIGSKQVAIRPGSGSQPAPVAEHLRRLPSLDDQGRRSLVALAADVERVFGPGQDIEWAIDDHGRCHLLQARPITVAAPEPRSGSAEKVNWEPAREEDSGRWWVRDDIYNAYPRTPLSGSITEEATNEVALRTAESISVPDSRGITVRTVNGHTYLSPLQITDPNEIERRAARFVVRVDEMLTEVDAALASYAEEQGETIARRKELDFDAMSTMDLVWEWREVCALYRRFLNLHFMIVVPRHISVRMLGEEARELLGMTSATEVGRLTRSMGRTRQLDLDIELWGLAGLAIESGLAPVFVDTPEDELAERLGRMPEARDWLPLLEAFLEVYGDRFVLPMEFSLPSWKEDPTPVFGTLRNYVAQGGSFDFSPVLEDAERERSEFIERRLERIEDAEARAHFASLAATARKLQAAMEDDNYNYFWAGSEVRRVALAIGRRLADDRVLESSDDVFFLEEREVEDVAKDAATRFYDLSWVRPLVSTRRQRHRRELELSAPAYLGSLPEEIDDFLLTEFWGVAGRAQLDGSGDAVLAGLGASPGTVEGTVRVVLETGDFGRIEPGDVLVCRSTTPSWTPVFSEISAIVTDQGGTLCHAAIVAREYGIPAVLGTSRATGTLKNGDRVRVDGEAGTVTVL